jgi:hypothetical protein
VTEFAVQQTQAISTSQRLWDDAYDSLEDDSNTAEGLREDPDDSSQGQESPYTSASGASDVLTELKDPTKQQINMKRLLKEG